MLEAERLQNASQGLSGRDAIQQALTNIYGDNAQQKAEEIARDADRKHSYDAGEYIRKARELYEDALKKKHPVSHISVATPRGAKDHTQDGVKILIRSLTAIAHPELEIAPISHDEIPNASRNAWTAVADKIKILSVCVIFPKYIPFLIVPKLRRLLFT